jgi:hypothetical protein
MPYSPVEDIPGIETSRVNIKTLDPLLIFIQEINVILDTFRHRFWDKG